MRELTKWLWQKVRIKRRCWEKYQPKIPKNGFIYAPPAAYRHLRALGYAMSEKDEKRVLSLQMRLALSGYEVPTTLEEVAEVIDRLEKQVNIR